MTAEEMFNALGYFKDEDNEYSIIYKKEMKFPGDKKPNVLKILFNRKWKQVFAIDFGILGAEHGFSFDYAEIKAINKQIEELEGE